MESRLLCDRRAVARTGTLNVSTAPPMEPPLVARQSTPCPTGRKQPHDQSQRTGNVPAPWND